MTILCFEGHIWNMKGDPSILIDMCVKTRTWRLRTFLVSSVTRRRRTLDLVKVGLKNMYTCSSSVLGSSKKLKQHVEEEETRRRTQLKWIAEVAKTFNGSVKPMPLFYNILVHRNLHMAIKSSALVKPTVLSKVSGQWSVTNTKSILELQETGSRKAIAPVKRINKGIGALVGYLYRSIWSWGWMPQQESLQHWLYRRASV
jgi:hypothetical protein